MARKPRAVIQTTPAAYSVPKLTLSLAVAEATDYVTATAGNASGIASFEFKWGTETGVYGDPVSCPRNFMDIYAETEALFVVCRGIAFDGSIGAWSDEATIAIAKNDFVSFEFPEDVGTAVIDPVAHTVAISVAEDTTLTALVAEFTVSDGATVKIGATAQESEVTENDFTNPVTYKITSVDEVEQEWVVTVKDAGKRLLTLTVPGQVGQSTINHTAHTVAINVPHATDVSALVATFTKSAKAASVKVGAVVQTSGVTANDFTSPVVYRVTAEDASYQDYTVTITKNAATNHITAFTVPEISGTATIDATAHTVALNVADDTNPAALVATFSLTAGASATVAAAPQESGVTANDFTNPVTYVVTGADAVAQNWVVTVTVLKDAGKAITAFDVPAQVGDETIDAEAHTISLNVPHGTDVSALVATFTLSAEASAAVGATPQVSGVTANNFTSPVVYRVTAEDLTYQDWTVTVVVNAATNNFTAFSVPTGGSATIDANAHTVAVTVPHGTNAAALVATFSLTAGASADISDVPQESGVTENNFSAPVVYTITGADAAEQNWTVTISKAAATNHITAFSMAEQTGAATINATAHTVAIEVAALTDVDHLVATFTLTAGASAKVGNTVQVSGDTQNNFTAPVVYAVTGADEVTQNWTVTVTVAA